MSEALRLSPTRASTRQSEMRDLVVSTGHFDAEVWHVMDQRDDALIANEVLNGAGSSKFVYDFQITGTAVSGISVIGARHLAYHYGGIKHRMIASVSKTGALFTYTSYPAEGQAMNMSANQQPELRDEPDFYMAIIEVTDVKRGNALQVERREMRWETRRDGSSYERPHFATIAQSKAYRNGVLALIPQDVQLEWKQTQLALGKNEVITGSVLEEKRSAVLRFAAAKGLTLDRRGLDVLMLDQIAGLSDAAREGGLERFRASAEALGLMAVADAPISLPLRGKTAAAASERVKPADPSEKPKQPETEQSTKQQPDTEKPKPAEPEPEPFEAMLFDHLGEPQMEGDGSPTTYTDPTRFARAIAHAFVQAPDRGAREALRQHNSDGWEDARRQGEAVARMLDALVIAESEPLLLDVPLTPRGAVHVPNYRAALVARMALISAGDELLDFCAANRANIMALPATGRLQCIAAVNARCQAVGIAAPNFTPADSVVGEQPTQNESAPDKVAETPPPDLDRRHVNRMKADIDACKTSNDLGVYCRGTAATTVIARLERENPALAQEVRQYADARHAALKAAG